MQNSTKMIVDLEKNKCTTFNKTCTFSRMFVFVNKQENTSERILFFKLTSPISLNEKQWISFSNWSFKIIMQGYKPERISDRYHINVQMLVSIWCICAERLVRHVWFKISSVRPKLPFLLKWSPQPNRRCLKKHVC